jgi:hypothetical protein
MSSDKRVWISNGALEIEPEHYFGIMNHIVKGVFFVPGQQDACWLWMGGISGNSGYGQLEFGLDTNLRCKMGTHVLMLRHFVMGDRQIDKGYQVNHRCDVRSCVNPAHLYAGTQLDNGDDRHWRGSSVDRKLLHKEVSAQIGLRKMLKLEIPTFYKREAARLNIEV